MIELKVLERYYDVEFDGYIDEGETIKVSPQRYKELLEKEKTIGRNFFEELNEEIETEKEVEKEVKDLTVKDIKKILDENKIEYRANMKKEELKALLPQK